MIVLDELLRELEDTSLYYRLKDAIVFFNSIENAFAPFCKEYNIVCPASCCECCTHFVPDLTKAEALLIASYTKYVQKRDIKSEMLSHLDNKTGPCPFCESSKDSFHCNIYQVRPLTCRLFGSCACKSKESIVFKRCTYLNDDRYMPSFIELKDRDVPLMDQFGARLYSLYDNSEQTILAPHAIIQEADKLEYILSLSSTLNM